MNFFKHSELGRTMVEMLAVLAIFIVLSVTGILGYATAMNYFRSNEVIYASTLLIQKTLISTTEETYPLHYNTAFNLNGELPGNADAIYIPVAPTPQAATTFVLIDTTPEVCKIVHQKLGTNTSRPVYVGSNCSDNGIIDIIYKK